MTKLPSILSDNSEQVMTRWHRLEQLETHAIFMARKERTAEILEVNGHPVDIILAARILLAMGSTLEALPPVSRV